MRISEREKPFGSASIPEALLARAIPGQERGLTGRDRAGDQARAANDAGVLLLRWSDDDQVFVDLDRRLSREGVKLRTGTRLHGATHLLQRFDLANRLIQSLLVVPGFLRRMARMARIRLGNRSRRIAIVPGCSIGY